MSKKEIEELVDQCRDLGWVVTPTAKGFYRILPPEGDAIITPGNAKGRANNRGLANLRAELYRAGFNPEEAAAARAEKAAKALEADRKRNEVALALAAERAAQRAKEDALAPAPAPAVLPTVQSIKPTLTNPFVPAAPVVLTKANAPEISEFAALAGYPHQDVRIHQKQSGEILAYAKEQQELEDGCRQRRIYKENAADWQQAMELGEWELNPADSLVFCKEHKAIVNGQHRMKGLFDADPEFIDAFYPDGVPFRVTYDFPCALSHIFDVGKKRSSSDSLTAARLKGWNQIQSAALRLALQFDQSFEEGGEDNWTRWGNVRISHTQETRAAAGDYADILKHVTLASRAYHRSKVTRPATMAAAFLIERDNPEGWNPKNKHTSILFWKGVCGDDTMEVGDPRMALIRVAMSTGRKRGVNNGPTMLAHILKMYSLYMIGGKKVSLSTVNRDLPMPPVWQPGMRWIKGELRQPMVGE